MVLSVSFSKQSCRLLEKMLRSREFSRTRDSRQAHRHGTLLALLIIIESWTSDHADRETSQHCRTQGFLLLKWRTSKQNPHHPVAWNILIIYSRRMRFTSTWYKNSFPKPSTGLRGISTRWRRPCPFSRSSSTFISFSGPSHTSIHKASAIEISNHRICCWTQQVGSWSCAILAVPKFSSRMSQMCHISVPDITEPQNWSLELQTTPRRLVGRFFIDSQLIKQTQVWLTTL